jgi:calcineurin-like phosphoesterase
MNFLLVGDVVGSPGRSVLYARLKPLIEKHAIDFTIVNGENSAGGLGITPKIAAAIFRSGADVITTGNHIWRNKEILKVIDSEERILRPLNFPEGAPGKGSGLFEKDGVKIGVVNGIGRVFMEPLDCPFKAT